MTKWLRITMPDGSKYDVPAFLIAENRAGYYSEKLGGTGTEEGRAEYVRERTFTLDNKDELIDWAANNMDWKDVEKEAHRVVESKPDFQEGWLNGDKEIVEYDS